MKTEKTQGASVKFVWDVKFVSRVLRHKLGLKVTNLDLLRVIEDEELFGKLVDDDGVRACLLLALVEAIIGRMETEIIPWGVAWSRKQLFKRSDYSLLFGKKLSASRKRGKKDTRDLPIIRRCDTTSVEEIKVKDCVISERNSHVYKFETIIKDKLFVAEFFSNISSEYLDALNEEFNELYQTSFIDNRLAKNGLDYDDDLVKDYLIQEDCMVIQEEEERCHLEDLKMKEALFLSSLKEEVKDLSRYNKVPDRVYLTDAFDIFLGRQGPFRAKFLWCKDVSGDRRFWETLVCLDPCKKGWIMNEHVELWVNYMWHVRPQDADWAMVGGYFVQLILQDTISLLYVDSIRYKVAWSDVEQTNTGVLHNLILGRESLLSMTAVPEWHEWMVVSVNTSYSFNLVGFNNDEELIIEVDDTGYQMDTTL
nr:phospholipase-like protein [Tanacetum cinerariifolium]